jgi:hypothetical protein
MPLRNIALCALLVTCSAPAWPQSALSRLDVFAGYSYISPGFDAFSHPGENGWNVAATFNAFRWLGFSAADFAQYRTTQNYGPCCSSDHSTTLTYLFGPRFSFPLPRQDRITPFGHLLFGRANENYMFGESYPYGKLYQGPSFAWMLGGGMDVRLTNHFSLRAEGDYLHTQFVTVDDQIRDEPRHAHARFSTGSSDFELMVVFEQSWF